MNKQKLMSAVLIISICFTSFAGCGKGQREQRNMTYISIISEPVPVPFDWQHDKAEEMGFFSKSNHYGERALAFAVLYPDKAVLYSLMATPIVLAAFIIIKNLMYCLWRLAC
ncbi:hypothetical protein [Candidatus Endomicrobiellum agilis]|uniref:hypothetical protein n=1 Tax=Candidatus Endomicrobiellum agilis TaxID=3238957 RepID=UPI0035890A3A|nr:hypothetical protein [Endomicrobium sp.]